MPTHHAQRFWDTLTFQQVIGPFSTRPYVVLRLPEHLTKRSGGGEGRVSGCFKVDAFARWMFRDLPVLQDFADPRLGQCTIVTPMVCISAG